MTESSTRLNIICALAVKDIDVTIIDTYDMIYSESIVRFFWKLKKEHYPLEQTVHICLLEPSTIGQCWWRNMAKVLDIELHNLPPYSPTLYPIGRLWKAMNECVRNNVYFFSKAAFASAIKNFFYVTLTEVADSLASRITDNFQILKPASSR